MYTYSCLYIFIFVYVCKERKCMWNRVIYGCICICIYIYIYSCLYMFIFIHVFTRICWYMYQGRKCTLIRGVCGFIYMYIYVYTCMYTYLFVIEVHVGLYICTYRFIYTYVCILICIYSYLYMCKHMQIFIYVEYLQMSKYIYAHIYIHIHVYLGWVTSIKKGQRQENWKICIYIHVYICISVSRFI
jgi:hypothetical protein